MAPKKSESPNLKFTNEAQKKLAEVIKANPRVVGLRLQISGRMRGKFEHIISMVEGGKEVATDITVKASGLPVPVYIEKRDIPYLDNLKVHYEYKGADRSGLEFVNPNPLWQGDAEVMLQQIIDTQLNPAIAAHGGYVNLLAVEGPIAYIEMGGGCVGCGMADVTLKQGIEASIVGVVPGIERVIDQTDHNSGTNPYYAPSKK